jgi:hypothetical protein
MNIRCSILWFRILWALTYVGTIILLMISVNHGNFDLSLRNTSCKMDVLLFSSYLSVWKFLTLLYQFRNYVHLLNTSRGPCTQSGIETLERIPVSISQCQGDQLPEYYLDIFLCLYPCEKCPCLQGHTKNKTLERNASNILMFLPHIWKWGKYRTVQSIHRREYNENWLFLMLLQ